MKAVYGQRVPFKMVDAFQINFPYEIISIETFLEMSLICTVRKLRA